MLNRYNIIVFRCHSVWCWKVRKLDTATFCYRLLSMKNCTVSWQKLFYNKSSLEIFAMVRAIQKFSENFTNRIIKFVYCSNFSIFHNVFRTQLDYWKFVLHVICCNNLDETCPLSNPRKYFKWNGFIVYYNFREVVRRTTVIIFTNKEDCIIASNKGGEVYRFGLWHNNIFLLHLLIDLLTGTSNFVILENWLQSKYAFL